MSSDFFVTFFNAGVFLLLGTWESEALRISLPCDHLKHLEGPSWIAKGGEDDFLFCDLS